MEEQEKYNQWAISMAEAHLKYEYSVKKETMYGVEYMMFDIPHPNDSEKTISISTYGNELTLYFCDCHEHHDSFPDEDHDEAFIDLCERIGSIMNDEIFFSTSYKGDCLCSGMTTGNINDHIREGYSKIIIKTWSGNLDQTIEEK